MAVVAGTLIVRDGPMTLLVSTVYMTLFEAVMVWIKLPAGLRIFDHQPLLC